MDVTARVLGQELGTILGQQFVVEYRAGASGTIGAEAVARASPDGYTLLLIPSDFVTAPALMPRMNFNPTKDLTPIAMVSDNPMVVVAGASAPFSDVRGLLEAARASPDGIAYATPGSGTLDHVIGEWIGVTAHVKLLQIPYKGGVEAAAAVVAGDVPLGIVSTPSIYPGLTGAGKVKVIALTGDRPPTLPSSWPTLSENGLPINATLWLGIFAPSGLPDAVVSRLDRAISQALQDDTVRKRMNDIGFNPQFLDQAAFVERIRVDSSHYEPIIRQTGIALER
ncbi:MAG: tripartite tricarboxylate transporter substrate binding protein [Xanthobacteraceae bacterium]|jgi:tripartite-type tricarboxylate transporter receptor subunit TctC